MVQLLILCGEKKKTQTNRKWVTWSTSYEILKKCKAKLASVFPSVPECCVWGWNTFLKEFAETIPGYHCWGWGPTSGLGILPSLSLPPKTASRPLEFGSVTPRYPELTVPSHPISHIGKEPTISHRQSCATEHLEIFRYRPSFRENSKKWVSVMSAYLKGNNQVFKARWCESSARHRYEKSELAHFMGPEKNGVSQPFWLIVLLYWLCFVSSLAYLSISWLKWIWKGWQTSGIAMCWPLAPTDSMFDMQIDFMGFNLTHFLYYNS